MFKIRIKRLKGNLILSDKFIKRLIQKTLESQGIKNAEVGLLIVGDDKIARLNRKYLGRIGPTDVLAFSMREGKKVSGSGENLGDVVISVDRAKEQAAEFKNSLKKELSLYVIHGVLHLAGHKDGSRKMEKLQAKILERDRKSVV